MVQRYESTEWGQMDADSEGGWVSYLAHVAEVQRVRSEWALKVVDAKQKGFVEGIKEGRRRTSSETKTEMKQSYQEGVAVGRAAGLDAARETVLAYADDTDKHVGTFGCYPENGDRCDITAALRVAAQKIDALREEKK